MGLVEERLQALREHDRFPQLPHPVSGVGRLLRGDPGAGQARDERNRRRLQPHLGQPVGEGREGRLHERGVEGVRGGQAAEGHSVVPEARLELLDILDPPTHHAGVGPIHHAEVEPAVEEGPHGLRRQGHRGHRPLRALVHEPGALGDNPERLVTAQHSGQARRHVLPEAVADHRLRRHPPGHPEPGQRVLDGEERGLREARLVQALRRRGHLPAGGEHQRPEVDAEKRAEELAAGVDLPPELGLGLVEARSHVHVLRPLSGEEERDRASLVGEGAPDTPRIPCRERLCGTFGVGADERAPVREGPTPGPEGEGHVSERLLRVRVEVCGQGIARPLQGRLRPRGHDEDLRPRRRRLAKRRGPLLQDDVRVGAADAEGAHPRASRPPVARPGGAARGDEKRALREMDSRVRLLEVQAGDQLTVLQHQDRLHEAGDPRGRVEVPDVRLHGPDGAVAAALRAGPERMGQSGDLDGIAEGGGGPMRLDVGDVVGSQAGRGQGGSDDPSLPLDSGSGEPHLARAVVVHGRALDHRLDLVVVTQGVGESLENDETDAVALHRPARFRIEGPAVAVARQDPVGFVDVADPVRHRDRNAPGQRHVALPGQEALAGHVRGHQRRRARGLDHDGGSAEVELVGDAGSQQVRVRGQHRLVGGDRGEQGRIRHHDEEPVAPARSPEDADRPARALGVVARPFQGFPGRLEEETLLRVQDLRLARRVAEEARVEALDVAEDRSRFHVGGAAQRFPAHSLLPELLVAEERHGLDAVAQVLPEGLDAACAREPAGHADDGDVEVARDLVRHAAPPAGGASRFSHIAANCSRVWKVSSRGLRRCPMAVSAGASTRMDSGEWPPRSKKLS